MTNHAAALRASPYVVDLDAVPLRLGTRSCDGHIDQRPIEAPSAERYEKLIRSLIRESGRLDAGRDALQTAIRAMGAVIRFLHADGAVILGGVTQPLMLLNEALVDAARGAEPALLFKRARPANRPGRLAYDAVRGQIAAAFDALHAAGVRPGEVAKRLAARLAAHKITGPNGKLFEARTLRNWWNNVRTRNEHASTAMLNAFSRAKLQEPWGGGAHSVADAEFWCEVLLRSVRSIFPQTPPGRGKV